MNKQEQEIFDYFSKFTHGDTSYKILRNGWPDFLVIKKSFSLGRQKIDLFCLEAKDGDSEVMVHQKDIHDALKSVGIPTYIIRDLSDCVRIKTGKRLISHKGFDDLTKQIQVLEDFISSQLIDQINAAIERAKTELNEVKQDLNALLAFKEILFPLEKEKGHEDHQQVQSA